MRVFLAALELRSFTKASVSQNISQPAATIIINQIEEEFQCELFERQGATRKTVATPLGQQVAETFSRIVANYDEELSRIDDVSTGRRAKRRVLIQANFDTAISDEWFRELIQSFSEDELVIEVQSREAILQEVQNRKATLGLVDGTVNTEGLDYHQLSDFKLVLAVPEANRSELYSGARVSLYDMEGVVHVLSDINPKTVSQIEEIERKRADGDLTFAKAGGIWPLIAMMKIDACPAIAPAPLLKAIQKELPVRVLQFDDLSLTARFGLVTPWGHLARMSMSLIRSVHCFDDSQENAEETRNA